jgi:DNA helicase HerA-like ATPase
MGSSQGQSEPPLNLKNQNFEPSGDSIGAIYGNISTTQFKFAVTGSGSSGSEQDHVKRTGYIQVWHERHGWVLGQIMEINLESSVSYSRAQQIARTNTNQQYSDIIDETNYTYMLNEDQAKKDHDKLAGLVNVLGFRDNYGIVSLPSAPFSAGQRVYPAQTELIRSVLGLDVKEGIGAYIGKLRNHDMRVRLNINELVQKHVSVIAKTGSGKSYMVGILIEELLKRKVPMVVLDPHGEYSGLMHPNIDAKDTRLMSRFDIEPKGYSDSVQEYSIDPEINPGTLPLKLPNYDMSIDSISELLDLRGTGAQSAIMYKAINRLSEKKRYITLDDLRHIVELDRNSAKWHLVNNLDNLISTGIFSNRPTRLSHLVQPGRVSIINLRGVSPLLQQVAVTYLSRQLFEARKVNKIPALMLIVEEAHQFCPQQGRSRATNVLKTIASEGRKFGLGLTVVTQRPALVDKNVLSQCNTQIILKVTNPNDLKALISSVEGLNNSTIDEIQRLPVSVGILVGAGIQLPIFVDIRVRETKHGGRPVDIISNVETFYPNQGNEMDPSLSSSRSQPIIPEVYGGSRVEPGVYEASQIDEMFQDIKKGQDAQKAGKKDSDVSITERLVSMKNSKILPDDLLDRIEHRFNEPPKANKKAKDVPVLEENSDEEFVEEE